jgi:uncharacterized protein (TIGR00266 family)
MQYELLHKPDFTLVKVVFSGAGERILAESAAMVAKDPGVDMQTQMAGGLMAAAKRRMLGGESIFQNTFTASAPGQRLYLAPGPEGDVEVVECQPHTPIFLSSAAFLASSPTVTLDTQWGGAKGFFSGAGLFLLRAQGSGPLFFASYGGIHTVDVGPSGYICDTSHMVGFSGGLDYQVQKVGGMKSLFFGGEGLVCNFQGQGRLWISTRNAGALASFLNPFRRSRSN